MYSLMAALSATHLRAIDLFRQWDEDGNGSICEKEFVQVIISISCFSPERAAIACRLSG